MRRTRSRANYNLAMFADLSHPRTRISVFRSRKQIRAAENAQIRQNLFNTDYWLSIILCLRSQLLNNPSQTIK